MAKYPDEPYASGYWCDPKICKYCGDKYDCCQCNQDNATYEHCEDCINSGLAPDWRGITKIRERDRSGRYK